MLLRFLPHILILNLSCERSLISKRAPCSINFPKANLLLASTAICKGVRLSSSWKSNIFDISNNEGIGSCSFIAFNNCCCSVVSI
ncbi:MAG: hypothetical protein ACEY3D_02450 [Rickettsia sp.]|uniref:hypothetical protein n=1 Tax=Rickettsia sp. TaxID=789 RepID=UPI00397E1343